jgi:hypothetical protein
MSKPFSIIGSRTGHDARVEVHTSGGGVQELPLRLDLFNHSPTGFEWGYAGSGPAQLALAMLAQVLEPDEAVRLHQRFKAEVVQHFDRQGFTITSDIIREWVGRFIHA